MIVAVCKAVVLSLAYLHKQVHCMLLFFELECITNFTLMALNIRVKTNIDNFVQIYITMHSVKTKNLVYLAVRL